jgi:hypothetical protein
VLTHELRNHYSGLCRLRFSIGCSFWHFGSPARGRGFASPSSSVLAAVLDAPRRCEGESFTQLETPAGANAADLSARIHLRERALTRKPPVRHVHLYTASASFITTWVRSDARALAFAPNRPSPSAKVGHCEGVQQPPGSHERPRTGASASTLSKDDGIRPHSRAVIPRCQETARWGEEGRTHQRGAAAHTSAFF